MQNAVVITGNIATEPELTYTPNGTAVAKFNVAVNSGSGEARKLDGFFPVTAWRELAEHVTQSLGKGDRVVVTGRLRQDRWESESGNKRSRIHIVADEISPSLRFQSQADASSDRDAG